MPNQVLENYRAKYPQYKAVDDSTLAAGIVAKYPQYKDALTDVLSAPVQTGGRGFNPALKAGFKDIGETASRGVGQLTSNPIAGLMNLQSLPLKAVGTAVSGAIEPLRQVPVLGDVVKGVESGLQSVGDFAGDLYSKGAGVVLPRLGYGAKSVQEIQEPVKFFGSAAGQAALTGGLQKGVSSLARKVIRPPQMKANANFTRAFPAGVKEITRPEDLKRMAPYLQAEQKVSPVVRGNVPKGGMMPSVARQLAEKKFPNIKQKIYSAQDAVIQRHAKEPLLGGVDEIAKNIESLNNIFTENIDIVKGISILDEAKKYRAMKSLNLVQARDMLKSINANLQEFYKKSHEGQAAAENMAKPIAEMEKAAESIREQIVQTLDKVGEDGGAYRQRAMDYGAASRLEAATERNISRHEAPIPPIFTQTSSQFYPSRAGALREVGEQTVGRLNTPERLAGRSMKQFGKGKKKPFVSRPFFLPQREQE